jgi:hypothetical protein
MVRQHTCSYRPLTNATSVAAGPDGAIYISNRRTFPRTRTGVRVELQDGAE